MLARDTQFSNLICEGILEALEEGALSEYNLLVIPEKFNLVDFDSPVNASVFSSIIEAVQAENSGTVTISLARRTQVKAARPNVFADEIGMAVIACLPCNPANKSDCDRFDFLLENLMDICRAVKVGTSTWENNQFLKLDGNYSVYDQMEKREGFLIAGFIANYQLYLAES